MEFNKQKKKAAIENLEKLAQEVLSLKNESVPRRPIVIEFCGSPKSGKSSCINALELFLRRNGFRTRLLTERASVCPVKNKFDPFFNIWTVSSALAELAEILSNHSKDYDVVIMDRGIFDGLCWFNFLKDRGNLDNDNFKSLESFLLMNRLKAVLDLVYIFTAKPTISLEREYAYLLTEKTGSIMKPKVLAEFTCSVIKSESKYRSLYQRIAMYDTSDKPLNLVSYEVTTNILNILRENIEEKIGYVDSNLISGLTDSSFHFKDSRLSNVTLNFDLRNVVERNQQLVQPIPILVIRDRSANKVLVVKKSKKRTSKDSPESGKLLLYLGGHIRQEDMYNSNQKDLLSIAKFALAREIKEEIGVDFHPAQEELNPLCFWVRDNPISQKHLAICFVFDTDADTFKIKLDSNEFVTVGKTKSGKMLDVGAISRENATEGWTALILEKIFFQQSQYSLDIAAKN